MISTDLARPQPLGVFPLPAGYLLIDGDDATRDELRAELVAGRRPASFADDLAWYERALDGDLDGALVLIDKRVAEAADAPSTIDLLNQFVLAPDAQRLAALRALELGPVLRCHLDTLAFVTGLEVEPPTPLQVDAEGIDGEFAAAALAAWATRELERHDTAAAIDTLERAAQVANEVSRPLAGQLLGQLANVQLDEGGAQRAQVTFDAALDALAETDLALSRADLHLAVGAMLQERKEAAPRLIQAAIDHYHQALALVTQESAPDTWAIANANLGLAYLTAPMHEATDQLRVGVAVQSMRGALEVFSPTHLPDRWSSTQLNLANALVYMPSKHQADNIAEAIGLYEGVLQHRTRHTDPQGRARVLANQGNALAHLGVFDDAKAKLHEARSLFEEFGEIDAVQTVRMVLDEIAKQESIVRQDRS